MSDFIYRVVLTAIKDDTILAETISDDYFEALNTAYEIAAEWKVSNKDRIIIEELVLNKLITSHKLSEIKQHDKILAYLLNIARKAQVTDDLELVVDSLIIADLWNHKAIPSAQIEYRIVYTTDFNVIVIIEGYHFGFHTED